MDSSSSGENAPTGVTTASASDSGGIEAGNVANEVEGTRAADLPTRPRPDHRLVRTIRRLDDPEVLQRVLAGLLNLR